MTGTRAAIRYAKAVLDLARDQNAMEKVDADMKSILKTLSQSNDLQLLLKSPIVKNETKKAILREVFSGTSSVSTGLIDTLAANKRLGLLETVAEKYIILYDRLRGKEVAVVTTAVPLTDALRTKVLAKVRELTKQDVTLENKIDESIIGGFILRIGDLQYNASIANKLNMLRRRFKNNTAANHI